MATFSRIALAIAVLTIAIIPSTTAQQPKARPEKILDVWSIAVSRDGKSVAGSAGWWDTPGEIGVWELESYKPLWRFAAPRGACSIAFSSDGKLLASGSWTGNVKIYDWAANKQVADFENGGVSRVVFSPRDEFLASAAEKKTLKLWDMKRLQHHANLQGDLLRFICVTFSPDGKKLLAGGGEFKPGEVNHVAIWDVETKQQVMKLEGHEMAVVCMTYSPDGNTIVTGSADKTIRFWDAKTGAHLKTLTGHTHWIEALVFTPDGKTLISGSHDRTIRFWDVDTGAEKDGRIEMPGSVRAVQLSPDGKSLFAGGGPKMLKAINLANPGDSAYLWNANMPANVAPQPDKVPIVMPKQVVAMDQLPIATPARPASRGWLMAGLIIAMAIAVIFMALVAVKLFLWRRSA